MSQDKKPYESFDSRFLKDDFHDLLEKRVQEGMPEFTDQELRLAHLILQAVGNRMEEERKQTIDRERGQDD